VPVASILSSITELLTDTVGDYGLYAIFLLMLVDAVFPAASEPVMVYGGAVAAGEFERQAEQRRGAARGGGEVEALEDDDARLQEDVVDSGGAGGERVDARKPNAAPDEGAGRVFGE